MWCVELSVDMGQVLGPQITSVSDMSKDTNAVVLDTAVRVAHLRTRKDNTIEGSGVLLA